MEHVETSCPLQKVPSKSAITIKRPLRLGNATTFSAAVALGEAPEWLGAAQLQRAVSDAPKERQLATDSRRETFSTLVAYPNQRFRAHTSSMQMRSLLCQIRIALGDDHSILFYGRVSLYLPLLETGAPFRGKGGLVDSWSDSMDLLFVPTCLNRLTIKVEMSIAHAYSTCRATNRTGKAPADYRDGHRIPADVVDLCKSLESSPASSTLCFTLLSKFG